MLAMVYSTVPIHIHCSLDGIHFDDDASLSLSSSDSSDNLSRFTQEDGDSAIENWKPFHHSQPDIPSHTKTFENPIQLPKPTMALPPLEDLQYPTEVEEDEVDVARHSTCFPSINRKASWGKGGNTRARVEMLQHQLAKPFRKLSIGRKIISRTASLRFLKNKGGRNANNTSKDETDENCSSNNGSFQTFNQTLFRDDFEWTQPDSVEKNERDTYLSQWRGDEHGGQEDQQDTRWSIACNLWPIEASMATAPHALCDAKHQEVEITFGTEFPSEELFPLEEFTTQNVRPLMGLHPVATDPVGDKAYNDGENSVILLHDLD